MYVQVKMMDTGEMATITASNTTAIKMFKELVEKEFNVDTENQRLFLNDRLLENQYTLFDYEINGYDVIQLIVETVTENDLSKESEPSTAKNSIKGETLTPSCSFTTSLESVQNNAENESEESKYFMVGDYVEVKDILFNGSWSLAKLIKIKENVQKDNIRYNPHSPVENDGLIYEVELDDVQVRLEVYLQEIRPYATVILHFDELKIGDKVLMNYNNLNPKERGLWHDVVIKSKITSERGSIIIGDIHMYLKTVLEDVCLIFVNDIYQIKPYKLLVKRTPEYNKIMQTKPAVIRTNMYCIYCKNEDRTTCSKCACNICGEKSPTFGKVCYGCNNFFHMSCLASLSENTSLSEYTLTDDWYCPSCKIKRNNIVIAEELNNSEEKRPEPISTSEQDQGKGMTGVNKIKPSNKVPVNHFGPIPGVEVGATWLYRIQVSEAGVHRPPVAGIHGRYGEGAFSIILSGSYDDVDNGDEVLYTGCGGRIFNGNKQNCDQTLTRHNMALALNCNAKIDREKGATAKDWKNGKPVRVVRSYKLDIHSMYAPSIGNRYDGIYKLVSYYPEKGISGYIVWRFILRRDDPTPSPWTEEGKLRIARLGITMNYPNYTRDVAATNNNILEIGSKRKSDPKYVDVKDDKESKSNNGSKRNLRKRNDNGLKLCPGPRKT